MTAHAPETDAETFLAAEFARWAGQSRITKRTAARLAIATAIEKGVLPKGGLVPPEKKLAMVMGISLGTVQAALGELQQYDVIIRRRGDGTRVASTEAIGRDVWHFRLLDKTTGLRMRITHAVVEIDRTEGAGPWRQIFAEDRVFLRLRRRLRMDGAVAVGAEMILPRRLAPGLESTPPAELQMLNIRPYLAQRYGLETSHAEQRIETVTPNAIDAARLCIAADGQAFQISATARAPDGQPVYFQRILAPSDLCALTF